LLSAANKGIEEFVEYCKKGEYCLEFDFDQACCIDSEIAN